MTLRNIALPILAAILLTGGLTACGGDQEAAETGTDAGVEQPAAESGQDAAPTADTAGASDAAPMDNAGMDATATVGFKDLAEGAEVTSPVKVCLEISGVSIEKSGEVKAGYGHHHILINPSAEEVAAITEGTMTTALAKDETHVHLGDGSDCSELTLAPGGYQLMAVVADGAHVPLNPPVINQVNITVK